MKKRAFVIDFEAQSLTLSAEFAEAANNPGSKEYALLCKFQHDFPNFRIVRKTHATPTCYHNSDGSKTTRNKHNNLTYERMERFMNALPDGAEYLAVYNELREKAEAMCLAPYAPVARWFMAQFPKFRENPLFYIEHKPDVVNFAEYLETVNKKVS